MEVLLAVFGGYVASGILAYGIAKNNCFRFLQRIRSTPHIKWEEYHEDIAKMCLFTGPGGLFTSLAMTVGDIVSGEMRIKDLGLTYRVPRQKALPTTSEKGLIKQTGKEKVLARLELAEKEHREEEKEKERALVLADQEKVEKALQKEISEKSAAFSELLPELSQELLRMKPKHMEGFGEDEYQHLDTLIRKKIGLRHRIYTAYAKLLDVFLFPAEAIDKSGNKDAAIFVGLVTWIGLPAAFGWLVGSLVSSGLVGLLFAIIGVVSPFVAVYHYDKEGVDAKLDNCKQCHYLSLSKFLKKHNVPKYLSAEKVKQLV